MKKPVENKVGLSKIREQALNDAAQSVKSIRKQKEAEPDNELVLNALHNSEEAMFFLATNGSGDDDERCREIMERHGLGNIV